MKNKQSFRIRSKLITIFILIKVLPLVVLAWFAWSQISFLVENMASSFQTANEKSRTMGKEIVQLSTKDSIRALDDKSREAIERLTVDTAHDVSRFLYNRDDDIRDAAFLEPSKSNYRTFLASKFHPVREHPTFVQDEEGTQWVLQEEILAEQYRVTSQNKDNAKKFHSRPPEQSRISYKPLYLEMTFVDMSGMEKIKISNSDLLSSDLRDISSKNNTFCKAETYFEELLTLKNGEIYVSDVIGAYQLTHLIGPYTKKRAKKAGIAFKPEDSGYAGKENPVGKPFQGLVRWATPVEKNGKIVGFVTLALDHTHIMEFTDHLVPTEQRFSSIANAGTGNYAFMWDHRSRNISHPRDYFIVGYDPETGEPALPWLEEKRYKQWKENDQSTQRFLENLPLYENQSLVKRPDEEQNRSGYVGLDCRYLNFAPQCDGWVNLTQHGGSGSFLIFWSGLWKLTTAATIPYYTGQYAKSPRGFGFVTIGANVDEFHRAAMGTAENISAIGADYITNLDQQFLSNQEFLRNSMAETTRNITLSTVLMIVIVIVIAICMASLLTGRITHIIKGLSRFKEGDMEQRIRINSNDELEELAETFNSMADTIKHSMTALEVAREQSEEANEKLLGEILIRNKAEKELAQHRDMLEQLVQERTWELESEILERKQVEEGKLDLETRLHRAEKMEAIGTLAGGVAHDLNNILSGILTYPEILLTQIEKDSPLYKPLETIQTSGDKAAAIVQDLLTLARRGVATTEVLNLNDIIKEYLVSPEHDQLLLHHPRVQVDVKLSSELMNLMGSKVHLFKTLMNLVRNGIESMTIGGCLKIQTKNRYIDKPMKLYDKIIEGDFVTLSISDSGYGIREEDINRIFEPFYTNKKMGRSGTGLGMAVVWGTVKDHMGYIDCQSEVNKGTVFTLYFPVCRDSSTIKISQPDFDDLIGNGESILLVDDVKEQLEIASLILSQLNYEVEVVASGEEALLFLEKKEVDLVILDMIMESEMDGLETYQAIRKIKPHQKTIIASGFSESQRLNEALELGVKSYLKKPYSITNLGQSVKEGLGNIIE